MAGSTQSDENGITGINVTPLVDVMLVLLIIFMVTANLINNKAIAVSLPQASTGNEPEMLTAKLEVTQAGELRLDGQSLRLDELTARIRTVKGNAKDFTVSIAADRAAPHGRVIDVIDALRKGGVFDFSFAVATE